MFWNKKPLESEEYKKVLNFILDDRAEIGLLKAHIKDLQREMDNIAISALEFKKKYKTKLTKEFLEDKDEKEDNPKDIYNGMLLPE